LKRINLILFILVVGRHPGECQNLNFTPTSKFVFDSIHGAALLNQCSRSVPKKVKRFWAPTQKDIELLENNFRAIYEIRAKECCYIRGKVDSLENFAFQYLGVVINRKKFIYINAFPVADEKYLQEYKQDVTNAPYIICDGGKWYWGVLFDIRTKQFSDLAFNGE
jgi:hypothetical protein